MDAGFTLAGFLAQATSKMLPEIRISFLMLASPSKMRTLDA